MTEPAVWSEVRPKTLAGVLRARAAERPAQPAFTFLGDGEHEAERWTYAELDARATAVAAALAESVRPGERALLLFPPGLDFIAAFFGCLYAGVVAVPAYPPRPNDRSQSRLRAIARDAEPKAALTTSAILAGVEGARGLLAIAPELAGLRWLPTDALGSWTGGSGRELPEPDPESVAFLQYTSGSTATPKGVMVTQANLVHNERMIGAAFEQDEESVVVGWLPLYHDMGLIGNVLQPLHSGGRCVLMSPVSFLQKPFRWLSAISRYRATTSGGPNFAYELCVRKIGPEAKEGLDLSSWRVAYNGAEPVRAETLERFAEAFAPCGFRRRAFYPCYGLAEATLFVTGGERDRFPRVEAVDAAALERHEVEPAPRESPAARLLVSCGRASMGQRVVVADPEAGVERPPGMVGEIWISGPSVARGYWKQDEATERDFNAFLLGTRDGGEGPYLRTGDLGFFSDGELFVTGRLKDLIILRGRNHYPQDLELTAERSHPDLRPGNGAAFSVDAGGEERLVVVHEVERRRRDGLEEVAEAVRRAVAEEHEVQVHEVVLLRVGTLPKTSSGKVQRRLCRELYLAGGLTVVGRSALAGAEPAAEGGLVLSRGALLALEPEERPAVLAAFLAERAAEALGVPASAVSPEQPLSGLGLDSLGAVELKGSVEAALGLAVPLADLLQGIGARALAERMLADLGPAGPKAEDVPPVRALSLSGDQPLSFGQKGLWFLQRMTPEGGAYNISVAARARGLDPGALERALAAVVARHDALRTVFHLVEEEPAQRALPEGRIDFAVEDARSWTEEELANRLAGEAWLPFPLETGPLARVRVFEREEGERVLLFAIHHLVADFWSLGIVARELGALYRQETGGPAADLPPVALQYTDFVHWQAERLAGERGEKLWSFWRERLAGLPDLDLPTDRPRPPVKGERGGSRALTLPSALAGEARAFGASRGATLFMTLLSAFAAQLARYSHQEDFAVGAPTAGRPAPELAGLVGYLVNTVALRADLAGEPGFGRLLDRVRTTVLEGLEHGDYPFPRVAERLRPARDPARSPLVQAMLVLQRGRTQDDPGLAAFALGEDGARLDLGGVPLESVRIGERRAQLDLTLRVTEDGAGGLSASLEYDASLWDDATAGRMLGHFRTLLGSAVAVPETPVWQLPILTAGERGQLLAEWNETSRDYPQGLLLHQPFEERAAERPEAEALVAGDVRLTYEELNRRANQLAHHLRKMGVKPEDRVGVCLRRSERIVPALLGVLKAGGAYVPLDPAYPRERLELILEDSGARLVVTEEGTAPDLAAFEEGRVERVFLGREAGSEETNPEPVAGPGNLAYLIYTSGSTGKPKAVAIEHRSAVVLAHWAREVFSPEDLEGVLAATSIGFDLSVFEIFVPLSWGGRVIVADNALALPSLPAAGEVTLINTVPSALAELVRGGLVPEFAQVINLAGEPIPPALVEAIHALEPPRRLYNLYGPSEDTTYSTFALLAAGSEAPIGRPLANTRVYLLDARGEPVPVGVPGELFLAGEGLARGYLGRPELTAERFVPDPFAGPEGEGSRLYRTGDLARWRQGGDLDFLGRIDHQVKVRGFRIELGEIEAALARHPRVREVVVVARDDGDRGKRLVAYVTPRGVAASELRQFLRESLPEHMVPTAFVRLDALPLSPNGKVDRKALPDPGLPGGGPAPATPRSGAEELLAGLVAEVLGVPRVGPHDDFFALGGHSLLATRLVARIARVFGVELPVSALFVTPTVSGLAARIDQAGPSLPVPPLVPVPRDGSPLPLSFAQKRLWLLDRIAPGNPAYNVPGALRLSGPLDLAAVEQSVAEIVRRHEALRTVFRIEGGQPAQVILPPAVRLPLVDLGGLPVPRREEEAERLARRSAAQPFDLARGPLYRTLALRLAAEEHRLLVTFHHIVADGWSLAVFLGELAVLYEGSPLPPLPVQYADWALWQREWLRGEVLESQLVWWRERLANLPVLELPADRPRPARRSFRGGTRTLLLPEDLAAACERLARRQGVTPFMVFLAAFQALLARSTGAPSIPVGSVVANRGRVEIEGLIGFFVNTVVLRTEVGDDPAFRELLARVREASLGAWAHQDLPFEQLVEALRSELPPSVSPLFQVLFLFEEPLPVRPLGSADARAERVETGTAKFDLTLSVAPGPEGVGASLEYDADLFDPATADRLLGHWRTLLEGIVADPGARLSTLLPLTAAELEQVLGSFRGTAVPSPAEAEFVLPRTPLEERLARIWSEVLGVTPIGVHDNFFELGGHSLLGFQVISRVNAALDVDLPLMDLFEEPTVAGLARRLSAEPSSPREAAVPEPPAPAPAPRVGGAAPRTPVEERLAVIWSEVLGVPGVGIHDDFFELGGHSLHAYQVSLRIAREIGVELPAQTLFDAPTVAALAERLAGAPAAVAAVPAPAPVSGRPLSFAQQRLWLTEVLEPGSTTYNLAVAVRLSGDLEPLPLARGLAEILRRHEPLRTVFTQAGGEPVQVVLPPPAVADLALGRVDLDALPAERRAEALDGVLRAEAGWPFDLARGPLARFVLLRPERREHVLVASFHHIAADGWSMGVFFQELAALYGAFLDGRPSPLPELPLSYADFALWQRRQLEGESIRRQLAWWRKELAGVPVLALPTDRPRSAVPVHRGASRPFVLPPELADRLRAIAPAEGITLFVALLGGFAAFLARWTGQGDIPIGVPAAGRTRVETEGLIGFFVNTLVLRGRMEDDPPFLTILRRLRGTVVAAQANQDAPFDKLVEELHPHRDPGVSPLFQVMLAFLAVPPLAVRMPGLETSLLEAGTETAKFDLTLSLQEREGSLEGSLEYRSDLFEAATIDRLRNGLLVLLEGAADDPSRRLWDLPLLTEAEQRELLAWGGTPASAGDLLLHELFEERARLAPGATALIADHGATTVTYGELDLQANRLAHHLRALGVKAETPVAVCLERSPDMVTALLAVWKAGGVYVPVDPSYPQERIELLLGSSRAELLVSRSETVPEALVPTVLLDRDAGEIAARPAGSPGVAVDPRQLAYVIYTSGSTGRPKGVAVEHGASAAHCETMRREIYGLVPEDRVLCFVSPGFDMVIEQTLPALTAGAAVVLRGPELWEPASFSRRIGELGVTVTDLPAAYWQRWAHEMEEPGFAPPALRLVGSGGGEMTAAAARRFRETALGSVRLINAYGPTETVITCSHWEVDGEIPGLLAPIGLPFPGRSIHGVDRYGSLVPLGAPGEAVVGGIVARGYLGSPELTAERFVPDPFAGVPGARVYRTGDLVRRLPDGILEFLGRIDTQVKIRGFRVETGEVEAALAAHPEVRHSVVVALEEGEGDRRLAAYFVPEPGRAPSGADLQAFLSGKLPSFMVPSSFTRLDALPLTPHGKVDRRALPRPEAPLASAETPGTPEEDLLAGLWSDLLGIERVGPGDDFFALGGHSLLATQLISRVRRLFSVDLPVSALFEASTPSALARRIAEARQEPEASAAPPIVAVPRSPEGDPPSFAQQRLWFLAQLEPESAAYNVPGALRLSGPLLPAVLAMALAEIVRRHEALRTVFREGSQGPLQRILPPAAPPLPEVDLRGLPPEAGEREAGILLEREAKRPFDLASGPLLRAALLRLGDEEHLLGIVLHHVVSDAWSLGLTLRELGALYRAFAAGSPSPLPELPVQYADFAVWQRSWLSGETLKREIDHWRNRLAGAPEGLALPLDRPRPAAPTRPGGRVPFTLPDALAADLRALGRREGWTPFMALLAAFEALLARLSGQRDVVVGSPIANRNRLEIEGLIGFFTNTLALRLDLSGDPSFAALAHRARAVTLDAHAHQDLPFEKLVEELQLGRDLSRTPVFQVMLVFQNLPPLDPGLPGVVARALDVDSGEAKFDLTLSLAEDGSGALAGNLEYDRKIFDAGTASRLVTRFAALLADAVGNPGRSLSELPLLSPQERDQIATWNRTAAEAPRERTVHELVAVRAALAPDAVAVEHGEDRLTYGELLARAGRLAGRLRARGVGTDVPVGVFLERSVDLVVAVLGVLEAGGACLPLDPGYPRERLRLMAEDAAAPVVVTRAALLPELPAAADHALLVEEDEGAEAVDGMPGAFPESLAYVIYTSGSTGRPKGVAMTHRALVNLLAWQARSSRAGEGARTLQLAPLSFDVSFQEIFSTWTTGGTLVLVSEETRRDPAALLGLIAEARVERLFLPFVTLQQLATAAGSGAPPPALREVMAAGEQLYVTPRVAELFSRLPGSVLSNQYGPTETHVATALTLTGAPAAWPERPSVGRPIGNARVFLLGPDLDLVPAGVPGDLYVGGESLARGYLGRPDRTAERFVPDPFAWAEGWQPGARLYRTGDLARFRPDGEIEFLGRNDLQVKVRGVRVELAEVEAVLARHPAVAEAAVSVYGGAAGESGAKRLVGYVVFRDGVDHAWGEVRELLARELPDAMIPTAWVRLDRLPLTPSGKVDRRALPSPEEAVGGDEPAPLRTPVEELLARIWREILEIPGVGANQSFFDLGGHSLLAARLAFRVREVFGVDLSLRKMLEKPVLRDLAAEIEGAVAAGGAGGAPPPIRPVPRDGILPLSFAQERLWFLARFQEGGSVYNVPLAVRLRGDFDVPALAAAFGEIVRRHETLRTTFPERDGEPVQVIAPTACLAAWELPVVDLAELPDSVRTAEMRALEERESLWPFPLERGPLLRTTALRLAERDHLLLLNMHHVISDGWSLGVLLSEASVLYGAVLAGEPSPLSPLGVQYADFAAWQRRWLSGERLARQVDFWRRQLAGAPAVLELPADRPRPAVQTQHGGRAQVRISPDLAARLGALARRRGVTPFMLLLAAWQTLLHRATGQEDLVVGSPIAGRVRPEVEPLIGFFVNTLALRGDLSGNPVFLDLLGRVRKVALAAYAHQELPFEKLVDELKPARDLAHQPLVQIMFALQNTPLGALELPGILLEPFELGETIAKLDVTLALTEIEGRLEGLLEYNSDLFDRSTMIRLAEHYEILLEGIAVNPAERLSDLHLLSAGERHQLLVEWGDAGRSFHGVCLHQLFERQAALWPDAPAAVFEDLTWTYGELDRRANQLAHHLLRLGVRPEVRVGLFVERSLDMLVGMLGTLKAGGAYVPLDPGYPRERLAFTLGDSGARVVLTQERLAGRLPRSEAQVVRLDADWETIAQEPAESPETPVTADDVAYVIYTSGSTGKPKGVMISHRAVVMYISTTSPIFGIGPGGRNMQFSSISFDASVEEIYGCLTCGAALYVRGEVQEGASELLAWMAERGITWAQLPTAFWHQLAAAMETESLPFPPTLRVLMIGGEKALAQRLVSWWKRAPQGFRFINAYGPTETTVATTFASFPGARPVDERLLEVPLGRPLSFVRVYVLDRRLRPVPIGVTGELHLGGQGLARGYLGRPDLTAEKFIPNPFAYVSGKTGERLYRTGDIVRLLPDGMLEFVGRVDDQVKIRGFRIELGEIETTLARHPQVGEAVVMTREDAPGEKHLVAYVSAKVEPAPTPEDLTTFLAQELPAYMVPGALVVLPSMPTNAHGKVDRRALAGIAPGPPRSRQETYVAPGSALEERIAAVWREIFGIEQVGVHDNFFDLGGNSLLIVKLHSRLQKALGRDFPLVDLFKHPTVAALAASLGAAGTEVPSLDRARARTETRRESMKQLQERRDRRRKAEKGSTRKL